MKKQDKTSKVKIRILSDKKLPPIIENESKNQNNEAVLTQKVQILGQKNFRELNNSSFFNFIKRISFLARDNKVEIDPYFNGIVIHFHGGGFVAMSSGSHQCYTRQ